MSGFAAAANMGYIFILKRVLEPILELHVQTPLEAVVRLTQYVSAPESTRGRWPIASTCSSRWRRACSR